MAIRAGLSAPRRRQTEWPWHSASTLTVPVAAVLAGERRFEAENFLSAGYGYGLALRARLSDNSRFDRLARVWQPSRLKGITVSADFGTPFLAATQAFDLRPIPRKFLSLDRTDKAAERFSPEGTILVTCSGTVGRATIATRAISGMLVSHDLLRIHPIRPELWGWIYAYLRSPKSRAMMTAAKYGHIIKHLEPSHLMQLPIPLPKHGLALDFQKKVSAILAARNSAVEYMTRAEEMFGTLVGASQQLDSGEGGFSIPAASFLTGRRRLEAVFHRPDVRAVYAHLAARNLQTTPLRDLGFDIWLPNRFKRIPAEEGVTLVGSADLFETNPDTPKRIADIGFGDRNNGRVERGWLLLARSGQTYGLNGTLALANAFHEDKVISDHVIRVAPTSNCKTRPGYVYTALSHPVVGRPAVKSLAYGSSIPEIEVDDVNKLRVVRLPAGDEDAIADLAEEGARRFAEADILETEIGLEVDRVVAPLIEGDWTNFLPLSA